jgi:hypothetical protein
MNAVRGGPPPPVVLVDGGRGTKRRPRLRVLPNLMAKPQGVRAVTRSPATAGGSCSRLASRIPPTWRRGKRTTGLPSVSRMVGAISRLAFIRPARGGLIGV